MFSIFGESDKWFLARSQEVYGIVGIDEENRLTVLTGTVSLADMQDSLSGIEPNSAMGLTDSVDSIPSIVLSSLVRSGWEVIFLGMTDEELDSVPELTVN